MQGQFDLRLRFGVVLLSHLLLRKIKGAREPQIALEGNALHGETDAIVLRDRAVPGMKNGTKYRLQREAKMQRIGRICILACTMLIIPAWGASSLAQVQVQSSPQPSVKIFTDGIARPEGRVSKALTEMARVLAEKKEVRTLPVMGYGGVANVDDLLHSRGVEFAVLNSDVLTYLDLIKAHPDARPKVRYVTRLFDQKAYLLARKEIVSLDQLAGKKLVVIGPESSTGITARVIFRLSGVKADIQALNASDAGATADAVFFLDDDIPDVPPNLFNPGAFHLIPVPLNDKLKSIYRPVTIRTGELPDVAADAGIATIAVETVLATFDWVPTHSRYADVSRFIDLFFASLPTLRKKFPDSIWYETDVHASVAGWKRYAYAQDAKAKVPPTPPAPPSTGPVAEKARPTLAAPPGAQAALTEEERGPPFSTETERVAAAPGATQPLRLSIVATPPLTDPTQPNGGLITELTVAVMERVNGSRIGLVWSKDKMGQIGDVMAKQAASLAVPWETPDCDKPQNLSSEHAALCDSALISAPLFQVPIVFVTKADSDFDFKTDESVAGRSLCLHAGRDLTDINNENRKWVENNKVTLLRPATLIDCLSMVERGEADALVGNEAESRFAINRLGLSEVFKMTERPLATHGIHIVIPKDRPGAQALLEQINRGITEFKKSGGYSAIVTKHLPALMSNEIAKVQ